MGKNVRCPHCKEAFELEEDLEVDDTVSCPGCYEELRVASTQPPRVEQTSDADLDDGLGFGDDDDDDKSYRKEDWS